MFSHPQNNTMPAALFAAHIQHRQLCNIFPIPKPIPAAWQPCHICLRPLVFSFLTLSHPQSLSPPSSLGAAGRPWPFHCAFGMAKGWAGLRFVSSRRDDCPSCSPPNAWMSSLRRLAWLGTGAVAPWRRHSSAESLFTYPLLRLFFRICSSFSSSCVLFFFFFAVLCLGCKFCRRVGAVQAAPVLTCSPPGLLFYFIQCWHHMATMATEYITLFTFWLESGLLKGSMLWSGQKKKKSVSYRA